MNSGRSAALAAALMFLLLFTISIAGKGNADIRKPAEGPKILFIGNSLTYANDMPLIVEAFAKAKGRKRFEVKMAAPPNFGLEDHWNRNETRKLLAGKKWDFVVMQQGPSASKEGRAMLLEYGGLMAAEIRKGGGVPAMYMVWPSVSRANDFEGVRESYRMAANQFNGPLLPVGEAWLIALTIDRSIQLFSEDGFHPTEAGSYLAALVIFEQLFQESPIGLPARVAFGSGRTIDIPSKVAKTLQQAAAEANKKFGKRTSDAVR
ncbi:MAG: SGNH/GDSL hydrolase family protein [Chloracidobacterium sp.]|nr:SGNH/GDSL hydrolase family protein [Chloracidobacterium sp.]